MTIILRYDTIWLEKDVIGFYNSISRSLKNVHILGGISIMKKFLSIITSFMLIVNMLCIPTSAETVVSENAQNALSFMQSVGIVTGNVIDIVETDNFIDFSVSYLPNNQISHLIYSQNENSISITIDEGTVSNEILFNADNTFSLDGMVFSYCSDTPATIDSGYYVYQYFDSTPTGWSEPTESKSKINDVVGATSWTVGALSLVIGNFAAVGAAKAVSIASFILSTVTGPVADYFGFSMISTSWKNTSKSPFQILTKTNLVITIDDVVKYNGTNYELATLA